MNQKEWVLPSCSQATETPCSAVKGLSGGICLADICVDVMETPCQCSFKEYLSAPGVRFKDAFCGNLKRRKELLALLHALPAVERVSDDEILFFMDQHRLFGRGLGLVDVHILASCVISQTPLWTLDGRLQEAADDLSGK